MYPADRNKAIKTDNIKETNFFTLILLKFSNKKIKEKNPDKKYYFQVIKRGGLKKYLLLDSIYRNCVKAVYTDESIQNIKIARGQMIV